MERFHYSGHDASKDVWTAADIESLLLKIASSRREKIEEYGADFMKYVSLNRLQRLKRRVTWDPLIFKARGYQTYHYPPFPSELPSRRIEFGPKWRGEIEAILSETDIDRSEISIFVIFNPQTKTFEFRRGPVSSQGRLKLNNFLVQTEIAERTPVVAAVHTHPLPKHVEERSLRHYRYPSNTAFFSPGDLDNIIDAMVTPFKSVISGDRMVVAINTRETKSGNIIQEFLKTRVGIPEDAFDGERIKDLLRAEYYTRKTLCSSPPDDFDMFEWNVEMAKKYRFALYRGSIDTVERVA